MPRVIQTIAFESINTLSEPFLNFFGFSLSLRQMGILGLFLIIGYALSRIVVGIMNKAFVILLFFAFGIILAVQKTKTISVEKQLLYAIAMPKPREPKKKESIEAKPVEMKEMQIPAAEISDLAPVKIVGMLRDSLGQPLANKPFKVYANGKEYGAGVTDETGSYSVFFMPPGFGTWKVEILPEGATEPETIQVVVTQKAPARR